MEYLLRDIGLLKKMNIKRNYSELSRKHGLSRQTVAKYDKGYEGKAKARKKISVLDQYSEEIKEKLKITGITVSGLFQYMKNKYGNIGTESNFRKYIKNHKLGFKKDANAHPRYETAPGIQLQADWKEDMRLINRHGEIFIFNVFNATLGYSRKHVFEYSRSRTREDVINSLTKVFKVLNGVPLEVLLDHMSSIIKNRRVLPEFKEFAKDMGFIPKKCKPYSPQTKGKVESKNRFLKWLLPYQGEFETEEELISIIKKIEFQANNTPNGTTGVKPNLLFEKEKEYLLPLSDKNIIDSYLELHSSHRVSNESLIYYRGNKYSVHKKYINKSVKCKAINGVLYIYYDRELIAKHEISKKHLNYHREHYLEIMRDVLPDKDIEEIVQITENNLKNFDNLLED